MSSVKMVIDSGLLSTPVPNLFIDNYMSVANPTYVIVYIYGFRQCFYGNAELTTESLSDSLNILETDVIKAWNYWEKEGLLRITETEEDEQTVEYLPLQNKNINTNPQANTIDIQKPHLLSSKPIYTAEELELYKKQSKEIQRLFKTAETALGKLLQYNDLNTIFGFYDWLRLPVSVVELLLLNCAENDHRNIRYIEKVALDWAEKSIDSTEKALEYIEVFNKEFKSFKEILKAFGQNREATTTEIKYMRKWLYEYKLPLELVLEACDKTVMNTGKTSFKYSDTIITGWHEKGISTLEAVKRSDEDYYRNMAEKAGADSSGENKAGKQADTKVKTNRFVNFTQREINFDELEKQEMEYLRKIVKEN